MTVNMFKNLDNAEAIAAGTTIFSEGELPSGMMYILLDGEVDIFVRGERIDTIGPGECLGEIGLVDNGPRNATAMAKVECRLQPIDAKRFEFLVQQTPVFALLVMQTMAERLRQFRNC